MHLILYSGNHVKNHEDLEDYLDDLFEDLSNPTLTYIPSNYEGSHKYFEEIKNYYGKFNIKRFNYLPIDKPFTLADVEKAMSGDVLYLSGGNAFYFLQSIIRTEFEKYLISFAESGKPIIGVNAGANLLTPTIVTATIPHNKLDKNEVRLTNLKGLRLVDFEFAPHYDNSLEFDEEIKNYAKQNMNNIYAVKDGSGIAIRDKELSYLGDIFKVEDEKVNKISEKHDEEYEDENEDDSED